MPPPQPRRGIVDTNIVILLRHLDPDVLPTLPAISTVTLAELSVGPLLAATEEERAVRQHHVQLAEADFEALPFDSDAARAYASVAGSLRHMGRKAAARRFDAMIAATALSYDLPLFTTNPDDLDGIAGLDLVAVPVPH
ncbi:MAG TPA: type II toxin-antitoxin system VapC family toxin [Acidimicrobiales bacterium]|nr:type II toxin-antitoxin system VapC family toxin [Acidimicrobiales bacterium]